MAWAQGTDGLIYWVTVEGGEVGRTLDGNEMFQFEGLYPSWRLMSDQIALDDDGLPEHVSYKTSEDGKARIEDGKVDDEEYEDYDEDYEPDADDYDDHYEMYVPPKGIMATSWARHSFIDEEGHIETYNNVREKRGASGVLAACSWHKFDCPDAVEHSSVGPQIMLTTPEGDNHWIEDLAHYPGQKSWADMDDEQ